MIKTEKDLNVKLESTALQFATSDWVPKMECSNIIPKQEDVFTHSDDAIKLKSEDDTTKSPKSEEEDVDSSLDFTLIDAGLIKSLMKCNKPIPKLKPKRQRSSSKTKKSSKKIKKCTPLDRTINATSKQLFAQLRNIKLEVKRESVEHSSPPHRDVSTEESSDKPLALSSLDDLDIPELKYPETFETSVDQHDTVETNDAELNVSLTGNDITQTQSDPQIISGPALSTNDPIDHKSSTDNAISVERSSTDMSETDSDHDINWKLQLTGRDSPTTERQIKQELIEKQEYDSDTETYSPENDTNDDDKVSVTSATTSADTGKGDQIAIADSDENRADVTRTASDTDSDSKDLSNTERDNENTNHSDDNQLHVESLKSKGRKRKRIHSSDDDDSNGDKTSPKPGSKPKRSLKSARKRGTTSQNTTSTTKSRKFKCPKCKQVTYSVQELNAHYRESHSPVKCGSCTKTFATPSGLHKHKYVHQEKRFKCKDCDKTYPFLSQLESHEITHLNVTDFVCDHKGCGKTFKRKNEYDRHVVVHDKIEHSCDHPGCDYVNYDIRNLVAHRKSHNPDVKPYSCKYCGKSFLHYTQRSRHYDGECTKMPSSKK